MYDVTRAGKSVGSFYRMDTRPVSTLSPTRFKPLVLKLSQKRQLTELLAHHIETYLRLMGSGRGWVFDLDVDRAGISSGSFYRMGPWPFRTPTSERLNPIALKHRQIRHQTELLCQFYRREFAEDGFGKWAGFVLDFTGRV